MDRYEVSTFGTKGKYFLIGLLTCAAILITPSVITCLIDDCTIPDRFIEISYD